MPPVQVVFAVLTATFATIGILLTIRNWVYGGSVIRVVFELGRRDDWGALATGAVSSWRDGSAEKMLTAFRATQVDVVKVTVRNLGRTAATILDVGLCVGPGPVPRGSWTAMPNDLLEPGQITEPVRIEAHDAKVFLFHFVPILRGARIEFGEGTLAFRASVNTGTGKTKLSRRRRGTNWNVLVISGTGDRSIRDQPLNTRDLARLWVELTADVYKPPEIWVRQITGEAARLVDDGVTRVEIEARLKDLLAIFGKSEDPRRDVAFVEALLDYLTPRLIAPVGAKLGNE